MDKTQHIDPNRTLMSGDMNRTMAVPGLDLNRTMAVTVNPSTPGIAVNVTPGREATMANGPASESFLLEIAAGQESGGLPGMAVSGARTPLNLCLCIDRSGSMEGAPLEYVKQACAHVVDMLSGNDVLSIVTFEEVVEVLMPPQRVTNRQAVKDGIARIQPGNTTNIYDALNMSLQQLRSHVEGQRATRMVVLSDGDPTAGVKDYSALTELAGQIKDEGITITFLGFGPDYNEELLAGMAKRASGNYYYIEQPQLIPEIFRVELEKLLSVAAQNLTLEVEMARWVSLRRASGVSSVPTGSKVTIPLTDLERGMTMQQVLAFDFQNHPLGWYRVAAARLHFDNVQTGQRDTREFDLIMEFTADAAKYSAPVNPMVQQADSIAAASRVVEKTIMGLKTGQITVMGALDELQKTQMMLVNQGRADEAREVTVAMNALKSGNTGGAEKTLMGTMVNLDQGKTSK
ncbi:MAG: VWA domain-containing protein [Chthonomonas sp.]|nr:VWA domain-containing protein [Chthonomonas sp.]